MACLSSILKQKTISSTDALVVAPSKSLLMLSDLGCGRIRAKEMKWDCLVEIELSILAVFFGPFSFPGRRKDITLNAATTKSFAVAKFLVMMRYHNFYPAPLKRSEGNTSILLLNCSCPRRCRRYNRVIQLGAASEDCDNSKPNYLL